MNVLSLFDGMSCGQIALNRLGIKYNKYFAGEIDKHAIAVTQDNYPNTIQLGDVTKIKAGQLPKIDLLMGGSPCQGFSFAGKQLNFEDPRSMLFFEYVRLLKALKPKYFILENVNMKKEYQDIISKYLGVQPIDINSKLVSAQNRRRLYWSNIPDLKQPEDKKIYLKDILETKGTCVNYSSSGRGNGVVESRYYISTDAKAHTLTRQGYSKRSFTGVLDKPKRVGSIKKGSQGDRVYSIDAKAICLNASSGGTAGTGNMLITENDRIRKLTPVETERLQTVPDNYTKAASNSQRYKMLGNGWTVDVIAHILKGIK